MNTSGHTFFVSCPKGLEELLRQELENLGIVGVKAALAGVSFTTSWQSACKVLMWTRLGSRMFATLTQFHAPDPEALYRGVYQFPWEKYWQNNHSFRVDAAVSGSQVRHSRFAAQKVKDGVVDRFRDKTGSRPTVDLEQPHLRLSLRLSGNQATVSLDVGGGALHARGYRLHGAEAPLKENLATAILIRAGWPDLAHAGGCLLDPLCGSGTLLLEGAMMAADIAPGLHRAAQPAIYWGSFPQEHWQAQLDEAEARRENGLSRCRCRFWGYDADADAISAARNNSQRAGLEALIQLQQRPLQNWNDGSEPTATSGLLVTNPPYGERLGTLPELVGLYSQLGHLLRHRFLGWKASVFTGRPVLGKCLGIRTKKRYKLFNGPLPCELLNFELADQWLMSYRDPKPHQLESGATVFLGEGAAMFRNRLLKNRKHIGKWAKRQGLQAYRIYDADLPEYNVTIDHFNDHALIVENPPPKDLPTVKAIRRGLDVLLAAPEVLSVERRNVVFSPAVDTDDAPKLTEGSKPLVIQEGSARYHVDLCAPDPGLNLHLRPFRQYLGESAAGKKVLHLFGRSGAETVAMAMGDARQSMTLDTDPNQIEICRRNLRTNGMDTSRHRSMAAECMDWLGENRTRYNLILLQPPVVVRAPRLSMSWHLHRDAVDLLNHTSRALAPGGVMFLVTPYRKLRLDAASLERIGLSMENHTGKWLDRDTARHPYQIFKITTQKKDAP